MTSTFPRFEVLDDLRQFPIQKRFSNPMQKRTPHLRELFGDGNKFFECEGCQAARGRKSARTGLAEQIATVGHFDKDYSWA